MLELFMQPEAWVIFATLFALEVVLGVDNVVFISVLCERLPSHQRKLARNLGIGLAVLARIGLVFSITWIMQLTQPLFSVANHAVTGRDMIMILGGAFLLAKSLKELWSWLTHNETNHSTMCAQDWRWFCYKSLRLMRYSRWILSSQQSV